MKKIKRNYQKLSIFNLKIFIKHENVQIDSFPKTHDIYMIMLTQFESHIHFFSIKTTEVKINKFIQSWIIGTDWEQS